MSPGVVLLNPLSWRDSRWAHGRQGADQMERNAGLYE
jgi:hypothetical protein